MSITREQVADLQPGDVVEIVDDRWPDVTVRGPLIEKYAGLLRLGNRLVRDPEGRPSRFAEGQHLTVVSRAPRLYVNHPRTEPVPGDVVRDEDGVVWLRDSFGKWQSADSEADENSMWWTTGPRPRLLVDGSTGQVVTAEDPLAHVRKGDPTPDGADARPTCRSKQHGLLCTREPGHPGQHIAGTGPGRPIAAVWS